MCGLAGLISSKAVPGLAQTLTQMNQTLHHRGPDQDGIFIATDQTAGLSHKRLSIIDLSAGKQPMTDCDGLYTLVFNGEIYNHHEIKKDLLQKGHPVHSRSDTETLLYAFKEYGMQCLSMLRGMFAFAIYDHRERCIFIARDRLGIKPLYYGSCGNTWLFASECKAILAYPGFDRAIDTQAVSDYLSLMYVPAPKSIFKNIRKLPAGHWMRISSQGDLHLQAYWDLDFTVNDRYADERGENLAQEDLLVLLDDSVNSHMESDVPLGAFLSGGVDSAAVVALMAKHSANPILTNTIGFSHKAYDESSQARETAGFFKTQHSDFIVEPDAVSVLDKLAWHYDEPFADSSMIPTYYVCQMARSQVAVALSGDGGDENFAGYRRYKFDAFENRLRSYLPSLIRRPLFGTMANLYPKADWLPQKLRAKTLLRNLSVSPAEGYFRSMSHFLPEMKTKVLSQELQKSLGNYNSLSVFEHHYANCKSKDPLSRSQYVDFKTYLVDDILTKVDRASMAVSLEVRVPILDHRLVELAATMPSAFKLRGQETKWVFKKSLQQMLPQSIFHRPKSGFSLPMQQWLRKELKEYTHAHLFDQKGLASTGLFETKYLQQIWNEHQTGMHNHTFPLFAMLSFALWHNKFQTQP